jgi:pimeloyl-ACP methyl ester carboxylesterase
MIEFFLATVFTVIILLGLLIANGYWWNWYYSAPSSQDETFFFEAKDGWQISVHRYRPVRQSGALPVILCHGLSSNRYVFDLPGTASLAVFLKDQGFDVWSAELRGSGMSARPKVFFSDVPYDWEFCDHLENDVPAIIDFVLEKTGAPKVHWVGHSMGGMLIMAHLAANPSARVESVVTLGSPVDFSGMRNRSIDLLLEIRPLYAWLPISPLPFFGRVLLPISHSIGRRLLGLFHPPNILPEIARKVIALASELVTSNKIWLTFGRYIEMGKCAPENGRSYFDGLDRSPAPILFIAGSQDLMAPKALTPQVCSPEHPGGRRECMLVGKEAGCSEDYGHMDLLVGKRSDKEVFPRIIGWIQENDSELLQQQGDSTAASS